MRYNFPLEMLSAVIWSERSYPAMRLAPQLVHKRFIILGPLVQENGSLNFIFALLMLTPKKDRIRTVSQRTKPNSRHVTYTISCIDGLYLYDTSISISKNFSLVHTFKLSLIHLSRINNRLLSSRCVNWWEKPFYYQRYKNS